MLNINKKPATSPASKKPSQEAGKVGRGPPAGLGGQAQDFPYFTGHPVDPRPSLHLAQGGSEKPKRPVSAMFIFSEEKRRQLQEERPELSESELTRLLARMWNDLSEKKKVRLVTRGPGGAAHSTAAALPRAAHTCAQAQMARGWQGLAAESGARPRRKAGSCQLRAVTPRGAGPWAGAAPRAGDSCSRPRGPWPHPPRGRSRLPPLGGERAPSAGGWLPDAAVPRPTGQVQGPGGRAEGAVGAEARR